MTFPSQPRIHGNGFIQVDLDDRRRLHIWDSRIPRQRTDTSIHDHSFGFHSQVLKGTMVNVTFWEAGARGLARGDATHNLYQVVRDTASEETALRRMNQRVCLSPASTILVHAGDGYRMPPGMFHLSAHLGTTVTVIEKDRPRADCQSALARVACRIGERPDNSWSRADHEIPKWAWELIQEFGGTR